MKLSIATEGEGPDLVLLHGWAMHGGIFAPLSARLAKRFRLHLVDLPGHGHSRAFNPGDLDPQALARQIAAQTPPALWLGWSLGGLIALRAALDLAQQVRGLIAIATGPRFTRCTDWEHAVAPATFREFGSALESDFRATIERFLALETLGSAHAQDELRDLRRHVFERGEPSARALQEGLDLLERCDFRQALHKLAVPSLWIAGRRDRLVPPAALRWAAAQCAHGEFFELSAGHAPFLSHADAVVDAVARCAGHVAAA